MNHPVAELSFFLSVKGNVPLPFPKLEFASVVKGKVLEIVTVFSPLKISSINKLIL